MERNITNGTGALKNHDAMEKQADFLVHIKRLVSIIPTSPFAFAKQEMLAEFSTATKSGSHNGEG